MKPLSKTEYIIVMIIYGAFVCLALYGAFNRQDSLTRMISMIAFSLSFERIVKETRLYIENKKSPNNPT